MRAFIVIILAGIVQSIIASYDSTAAQNNELKRTPMTMRERFVKMCRSYSARLEGQQYAVAWIGDDDYSKPKVTLEAGAVEEATDTVPADKNKYYIAAAVEESKEGKKHTEETIFEKIDEQIKRYKRDKGKDPAEVYLFTKLIPCCYSNDKYIDEDCPTGCSTRIRNWASKPGNPKITVAWDNNKYKTQTGRVLSIYNILRTPSQKAKIYWDIEGNEIKKFCEEEKEEKGGQEKQVEQEEEKKEKPKHKAGWLQKIMFNCIVDKVTMPTRVCSNDLFKKDLAKLVNRITWGCAADIEVKKPAAKATNEPPEKTPNYGDNAVLRNECWADWGLKYQYKKGAGMLKKSMNICCSETSEKNANVIDVQIGPPLDPDNTDGYSNKVSDIKEESTNFCFTL